MNEKKLHVEFPKIKCYPHHAHYMSTVIKNDYDLSIIATNFIQLVYRKDIKRLDYNIGMDILSYIKNYMLTDKYCYSREIINKKPGDINLFIIEEIEHENYVTLLVDKFYISAYTMSFKEYHEMHNIMVYGFDCSGQIFYCADCFENGKYTFKQVTFQEMENAFLPKDEYDWLEGIHTWKEKENVYMDLTYNSKNVKKIMKEYLNGERSYALTKYEDEKRNEEIYVYGQNVYKEIQYYVEQEKDLLDIRICFVLYEHKEFLLQLMKNLNKFGLVRNIKDLIEIMEKNIFNHEILLKLFIKYNMVKKENIKVNIIKQLNECCSCDSLTGSHFLHNINTDYNNINTDIEFCNIEECLSIEENISGDWKKICGNYGYDIVGDKTKLPNYIDETSYSIENSIYVLVFKNNADYRALSRVEEQDRRLLAYLLNDKPFNLKFNIIDGKEHILTLYCVDYDYQQRDMIIYVYVNDICRYKTNIQNFEKGIYVKYRVKENVKIVFESIKGPNAVLSGVFWD